MSEENTSAMGKPIAEQRKTAGQIALELHEKDTVSHDPIELQRTMLTEDKFNEEFQRVLAGGKKDYPGDFFIVWLTWRDRVFPKMIHAKMFARQTCIQPSFGQTVWRYIRNHGAQEELWTIPLAEVCAYYLDHALEVHPEERALLDNVLKFNSGELDVLCNRMNLLYNKPIEHQLTAKKNLIITEVL